MEQALGAIGIVVFAWWITRSRSRIYPLGVVPVAYLWFRFEPALLWLIYLRNCQRIARFLKMADSLRVRQKPNNGVLPRITRG